MIQAMVETLYPAPKIGEECLKRSKKVLWNNFTLGMIGVGGGGNFLEINLALWVTFLKNSDVIIMK